MVDEATPSQEEELYLLAGVKKGKDPLDIGDDSSIPDPSDLGSVVSFSESDEEESQRSDQESNPER